MSELIVAVFEDAHTAFLARAALARLQKGLSLSGHDLAVVTLGEGREVAVQESVDLGNEAEADTAFWRTLVNLLFAPGPSAESGSDAASEKLVSIGIDATSRSRIAERVRAGTAGLLVLARDPAMRDKVVGVLRGFHGEIVRVPLTGDDREVWRCALLAAPAEDAT